MSKKGYKYEEKFVRTVRNWRRACDERGLSSLQRSKFNYQLLNLILDELMPWHTKRYDFSLLEVNRYKLYCSSRITLIIIALSLNINLYVYLCVPLL